METRREYLKKIGLGALAMHLAPAYSYGKESIDYNTGDISKIYLNANENPYGPSPLARKAMTASIAKSNRYGWSKKPELISAIATYNEVGAKNIMLGSGST